MFSFLYDAIVFVLFSLFFFKQKTAYEMRISDWSSDVCSCDLNGDVVQFADFEQRFLKDQRGGALHDLADSRSLLLTGEGAASAALEVVAESRGDPAFALEVGANGLLPRLVLPEKSECLP